MDRDGRAKVSARSVKVGDLLVCERGDVAFRVTGVSRNGGRVKLETPGRVSKLRPFERVIVVQSPRWSESPIVSFAEETASLVEEGKPHRAARARALDEMMRHVESLSDRGFKEQARSLSSAFLRLARASDEEDYREVADFNLKFAKRHGNLLEYSFAFIDDPGNRWRRGGGKSKARRSVAGPGKAKPGTKRKRPKCDACGAPLVRIGPSRRRGWGLYRCDYCDSEYSVKEV
jgi:hypothetical protein